MDMPNVPNPHNDGVTHINIWSRGSTELGRLLSNFAYSPFIHPKYGRCNSMEGFYYFVSTGCVDFELLKLYGHHAKLRGRTLSRVITHDFDRLMRQGLELKVRWNAELRDLLVESVLPFEHYYVYGTAANFKVVKPKGQDWLVVGYERIREEYRLKELYRDD